MIIDELLNHQKQIEENFQAIKLFWENAQIEQKYKKLEGEIHSEEFWKNPKSAHILKEYQQYKEIADEYKKLKKAIKEYEELLLLFKENEDELLKLKPEIINLEKEVTKFKLELLLNKENDLNNCFLSINPGAGGTESQDWAEMLMRMYIRFCERENFNISIVDYQPGEEAGIKNAILFIKGKFAYGFLKAEKGIHRLVRISPFDANKRRHTSFVAINVIPEVEEEEIKINEQDLKIDTFRAGGAGGQHVNKTDSAVRITHLPTGIVVQCQNERSQLQNKKTALKILTARLKEKKAQEQKKKAQSEEKKKIEWGSQIRSYILHPYKLVKDHRTNHESHQPEIVLDGELMPFIEAYLTKLI